MGVSPIGNMFKKPDEINPINHKPETAGTLALGGAETAGSLATNNVGGSFCAMA